LSVRIPLLDGEAVTDPGVKVENGEAVVDLAPGTSRTFSSVLEHAEKLRLVTSTHPGQIERWAVSATPLWHVESAGLAPAAWTNGGSWQPRWLLWPGEAVDVALSRPLVIDGDTLTIDEVRIDTTVGQRSSEALATLRLRSSAGGNHVIGLPDGAELLAVRIDGEAQPLRAEKNKLALPITPGGHSVQIDWRDASARSGPFWNVPESGRSGQKAVVARPKLNKRTNGLWAAPPQASGRDANLRRGHLRIARNMANPSSMRSRLKSSVTAIGGGGISPARSARNICNPLRPATRAGEATPGAVWRRARMAASSARLSSGSFASVGAAMRSTR